MDLLKLEGLPRTHLKKENKLDADTIFQLYDTYGFPIEITEEIAKEKNIEIDKSGYEKLMSAQKISAVVTYNL